MTHGSLLQRLIHHEGGGIMVFFVVAMPVMVLFASLAIDAANWWEHKRHLQMQADAAALAGAAAMSMPCSDEAIQAEILKYSGTGGSQYNAQIGGTPAERLHMAVNSRTFPLQTAPVDDTVLTGSPCENGMVDVKLTETDVPWFIGMASTFGIPGAEFVNARARARMVTVDSISGAMPIGVPDVDVKRAKVVFINEDNPTGPTLGEAELSKVGEFNGYVKWEVPAGSPISLTVANGVRNIGMRVVLSSGTSLTCGELRVDCHDLGSPNGVVHLRGWTDETPGTAPIARSVGLRPTNCLGTYFTFESVPCATGVSADVDFGTDDLASIGAKVSATVAGTTRALEFVPGTCPPADPPVDPPAPCPGRWELPAASLFNVAPGSGPRNVELRWEQTIGTRGGQTCTNKNSNPCKGTFGNVQRTFAGTDGRTGPIRIVNLYGDGGLPLQDHSLEQCSSTDTADACTYNITVELGLLPAFEDAKSVDSPLIGLRVTGGSQNQSLDCGPTLPNLRDELVNGCYEGYKVNEGTACPDSINDLWSTPEPWPCVAVQTGGAIGQVSSGMNKRILGSEQPATCTAPNRWYEYWESDPPAFDPADRRIVDVFLTPFGTFSGSGNTTVPVVNFATFYVSGWVGNAGFTNPCTGQDNEVIGEGEPGYIYGRFIKTTRTLNNATGNTPCDMSAFGACTAVLTD